MERFVGANEPAARLALVPEVLDSGISFEDALAALRRGRAYSADVPTGKLLRERTGHGGLRHPYVILVPPDYSPGERFPVRVDLHGGMGAKEWKELDGAWSPGWRPVRGQFVVLPAGWWDSMWWEWSQVENLEAILREVRATWNVDEDRVVLAGASDGGAALYFHAMRSPDRWAGYAGSIAPPDRLVRADFRPDGQMHVSNLAGQRFHLGFGEKDRKVPIDHLRRYMALFEEAGADLRWFVNEDEGHSMRFSPEQERAFARFLWETVRDPLPNELSWSTERTDRYARRSWLVIDELEPAGPKHEVDESNLLPRWGTRIQLRGKTSPRVPWGRVALRKGGNRVRATTRRVRAFTLLVSPDHFDLSEPIVVEVDGEVRFDGRVEPSLECLLSWAAVDDDRRRLFAAQIRIRP